MRQAKTWEFHEDGKLYAKDADGKWHLPDAWAWYEYELQQNMQAVDRARSSMAGPEGTGLPIAQQAVRSWAASSSANADA